MRDVDSAAAVCDCEAVVLNGDEHAARLQVADGMVRATVPERKLERLQSECKPENLVPQADAEQRYLP